MKAVFGPSSLKKITTGQPSFRHGKTVLLVDVNTESRDKRAKTLRSLGVAVHCATDMTSAHARYASGTYNLVLVDFGRDTSRAQALADEIRALNPRQLVAFLIGSPLFVSNTLKGGPSSKGRATTLPETPVTATTTSIHSFDFAQRVKEAEFEASAATDQLRKDVNA